MVKYQIHKTELLNQLENIHFKLVFMEAAFRGMIESEIIIEKGVSEGASCIFNSIIHEHEIITKKNQKIFM